MEAQADPPSSQSTAMQVASEGAKEFAGLVKVMMEPVFEHVKREDEDRKKLLGKLNAMAVQLRTANVELEMIRNELKATRNTVASLHAQVEALQDKIVLLEKRILLLESERDGDGEETDSGAGARDHAATVPPPPTEPDHSAPESPGAGQPDAGSDI